jgi:16S rRNA (uracil1498-N3)-methyltransferase
MSARFYVDLSLAAGASVSLPLHAARHVQVLRLQPGDGITLFNGQGDGQSSSEGEFAATIERMGRSDVQVLIGPYTATRREAVRSVQLAIGMPANERMDWLVEKASELASPASSRCSASAPCCA